MFNELKNIFERLNYDASNLFHSSTGDGRLDSAESEQGLIQFLIDQLNTQDFKIEPMPARSWCDIKIYYKGNYFPINIKITSGKGADNISSKEGMFYALTGIDPTTINGLNRWEGYIQALKKYTVHDTFADYYFLIYFKEESKFLFTSLKRINILTPNGSNLPFQCNWSKNMIATNRTTIEQSHYILEIFTQSYLRKAKGLESLLEWSERNYE